MKKILRIVLILIGVSALLGTFYFLWKKSQPEVVVYNLVNIKKGDIVKKTLATGKIEPRDEILIKPQISGIVTELYKEVGEVVKEGDVIAKVKVIPEMGQLNQAQSGVRQSQLQFEQTTREYNRIKKLYEEKVVAREEYEKMRTAWESSEEDLQRSKDNLEIVTEGISKRSGKFNNTMIRSTISGIILEIPIKVGNSVILANTFNEGTTIASVADLRDMIFQGNVDETEVGKIRNGMPLKLTIGAMQQVELGATLEYISPKAKEDRGAILFEIKAAAQIPDSIDMRAGYSANAEIILDERKDVFTLPENTIVFEKDSTFVYTLTSAADSEEQKFTRTPVKIGLSDGVNIEITDGLDEKSQVRGNKKQNK